MIELKNVTMVYHQGSRQIKALDGINLNVPGGQFLVLMGPSGSGKSTLIHLIAGLETPTEGKIYIDGRDISSMSDDELTIFRRQKIGLIFQFFNLIPTLNTEENVLLPLLLNNRKSKKDREKVYKLLEAVGLKERSKHKPDELSGGEMQRVAIARALVIEPLILLADEPTGNLDSKTTIEIMELLREIRTKFGPTIILATHNPSVADYSDRVIYLKDGHIIKDEERPDLSPS